MELGNALNWFEIPVADSDRAKKIYETIFNYQMTETMMGPNRMEFFLCDQPGGKAGGAIVYNPGFYTPAANGTMVYLNCQPDLQIQLDKVVRAGGKILQEKMEIAPGQNLGFIAIITDCEATGWHCILWDTFFL